MNSNSIPITSEWVLLMKSRIVSLFFVLLLPGLLHPQGKENSSPLLGFERRHANDERKLEEKFDSYLDAGDLRTWLKTLSAHPHNVGSPYDKKNAEFLASLFKSWGYETSIEEFQVLYPTPKTRKLEMISPSMYTARLEEPPVPGDSTSMQTSEELPTYNAFSIDGDVTGDLVYVNYGIPKDYDELDRRGIDVKGKIVIARYGGSWRGIKPKVAAEHGAVGCIIYSDPNDDGYYDGDVYPKGAFRSAEGVQRGSVADIAMYSGDPLTPGIGATKDAKRLPLDQVKIFTKIPVLPISYGDAQPLLEALQGPVAPEPWRGALPITYHLGPGPARVHLEVTSNWDLKPIYDVIAQMKGSDRPDEWVIRGNHHDAWVNGANDPLSGAVCLLEEAKAVSKLARQGWKPRRTLVYCVWDGEEPGLFGSTEWAETHADALRTKAVAYINSDSNDRGFLFAGASHTLEKFVSEVARDVTDPETHVSVFQRSLARQMVNNSPEEQKDLKGRADLHVGALGSGSDYTPFLQHLGIASCNIGYGGESDGGEYHSIYDSYEHYLRFGDPTFAYGVTLAKTGGRMVMRLADADVVPLDFSDAIDTYGEYVKSLVKQVDDMRTETEDQNAKISNHYFELSADPQQTFVPPRPKDPVPYLDFSPIQNAIARLRTAVSGYESAMHGIADGIPESSESRDGLDQLFINAERALTRPEGLPRRPWFIHEIYAPGQYTGYGVKTFPAVREAIEQRNWSEAGEQIPVAASVLEKFAGTIERATAILHSASK